MQDLGRENEQKIIDFASNVGTYVAKTSKIFLLERVRGGDGIARII